MVEVRADGLGGSEDDDFRCFIVLGLSWASYGPRADRIFFSVESLPMLTRLKVEGFKNLIDTELCFGPLTCLAGPNGVGKSNVFDAIRFLSLLADRPFVEAAAGTRGGEDMSALFSASGDGKMVLECDMLISRYGQDDFNQPAEASHTFLTYLLELHLVKDESGLPKVRLERESLAYIPKSQARKRLGFKSSSDWIDSVMPTSFRRVSFIETVSESNGAVIRLRSDKMRSEEKSNRGGGRSADFLARNLPRTVLSSAQNADETRTAVLVRQEMRSWRILQLEPSALRRPDDFQSPTQLAADGSHLPATLYRLARNGDSGIVLEEVANRLASLVTEVHSVRVDRDEARRVLSFVMMDRGGIELPASSLSDGTLRFVALTVLEQDASATGVLCLEEPENGIHPGRIDAMMQLLEDMAVDVNEAVGQENPLRQVVLSTHSPVVAARVRDQDLVFADRQDIGLREDSRPIRSLVLRPIAGTWRCQEDVAPIAWGEIAGYLDSVRTESSSATDSPSAAAEKTVFEQVAGQMLLPFMLSDDR